MKRAIVGVLVMSLGLLLKSCNTTEPPPDGQAITLKLEDVSCTETWIELTTTNLQLPTTITLRQINPTGDTKSHILNLNTKDSLLYIDSLLPNKSYQYQVSSIEYQVSSNELNVTTMDTTSHDFTWQTWTFGEHSSSVLYDVAIINENSIYAVGEIYMNDTLGQPDPYPYNLAIWDGNNWELMKLTYQGFPPVINSVCAINKNDIWFDPWFHWNGQNFQELSVDPVFNGVGINKMWGNEDEIYVVGNEGFIAHRNANGSWRNLESGTDVDIQDIWGITSNNITPFILCAVSYVAQLGEHKILRINNSEVDSINWGTGRRVHSVWFDSDKKLYACGGGIFFGSATGYNWIEQTQVPLFFTERVRGKGKNDLFVVGHFGLLAHFNGTSWKTYPEAAVAAVYTSLDYKNNLMVTVGLTESETSQAVIQFMIHI